MVYNFWHIGFSGVVEYTNPGAPSPVIVVRERRVLGEADLFQFYKHGELHEMVPIRNELQALEDAGTITVVGSWDFYTGQPIGGVGSPWFLTPDGFDTSSQRQLVFGQADRIFI